MYKNNKRIQILLLINFLLVSCATTPLQPIQLTNNPDYAYIYIYKPSGFVGSLMGRDIYFDKRKVGTLRNGKYLFISTTPGKHLIQIEDDYSLFSGQTYIDKYITVRANHNYFYKMVYSTAGSNYISGTKDTGFVPIAVPKIAPHLESIPHDQALIETKGLSR